MKRSRSRVWRWMLPERIFTPELWLPDARGISLGAAFGVFWALAPVPMQSVFAALSALWSRANIPAAIVCCWISFPGYQLIVWPLQWWLGHLMLSPFGCATEVHAAQIKQAAAHALAGDYAAIDSLTSGQLPGMAAELLLGCLLSCCAVFVLIWGLCSLLFRLRKKKQP